MSPAKVARVMNIAPNRLLPYVQYTEDLFLIFTLYHSQSTLLHICKTNHAL